MSVASDSLREFNEVFDITDEESLPAICRRRITLLQEEHDELIYALDELARSMIPERRELTEAVARELGDVLYIAYGTAAAIGVDLDKAFDAVHRSNMAKFPECLACAGTGCLGVVVADNAPEVLSCGDCNGSGRGEPIRRESDKKIVKPKSWKAPNMEAAVRE